MKRCKIAVAKIQAVFYKFNKFAKNKKKTSSNGYLVME